MILKDKNNNTIHVDMKPGDYVIDCGANVGNVTNMFLSHGANVIAFEPNPHAFNALNDRFKNTSRVRCINKGVGSKKDRGMKKLFFHQNANENQLVYSTGCSIVAEKNNVNKDDYTEVEIVELCKFLKLFNKKIKVLKIDIEGAEVELLNDLLDSGLIKDIPYVFVETHEEKIPSIKEKTEQLKKRIIKENHTNVNLNWI